MAPREGGREVYLQSRLLKRTVLVARAQTALYLAAGHRVAARSDYRTMDWNQAKEDGGVAAARRGGGDQTGRRGGGDEGKWGGEEGGGHACANQTGLSIHWGGEACRQVSALNTAPRRMAMLSRAYQMAEELASESGSTRATQGKR